ncbi:MAG: hypothetical protein WD772_04985, partial [Pseudohongiellaceae bacterium]
EQFAMELETWRQAAARVITGRAAMPTAAVRNHVYLFADAESFGLFVQSGEQGQFFPTPRRNFMTVVFGEEDSLVQARHYYLHFLIRNFVDLGIPRWYEEGLVGYLDSLQVEADRVELVRYQESDFRSSLQLSREVSLQELLYDEEALASPRLIQVANLKSETFLHFLLHAWEEQGYTDRRPQLNDYLALTLEGRTQRFAFDQAFGISPRRLDDEYENYLRNSNRPQGTLNPGTMPPIPALAANPLEPASISIALGELALHSGHFALAGEFFRIAMQTNNAPPRSISGYADAIRMQELPGTDAELSNYYAQALAAGPQDVEILLDYGEYLETVVDDCERMLAGQQRSDMKRDMLNYFSQALALAPENPEANLAMAQYYLLDGEDLNSGIASQRKAMALLPADTFVMEQAINYAIEERRFDDALRLVDEVSQPLHFWGEPEWVGDLRASLTRKQSGLESNDCIP